jgi:hypothetical protein
MTDSMAGAGLAKGWLFRLTGMTFFPEMPFLSKLYYTEAIHGEKGSILYADSNHFPQISGGNPTRYP